MKKFFSAAYIFAISVFIVDWGYVGILLLNGNYEIRTGGIYRNWLLCRHFAVCFA